MFVKKPVVIDDDDSVEYGRKGIPKNSQPSLAAHTETIFSRGAKSSHGPSRKKMNLYVAVQLPQETVERTFDDPDDEEQAIFEWWAENIVAFVNETQVFWSVIVDDNEEFQELLISAEEKNNNLYPKGVTYKWQDPGSKQLKLNIQEYVEKVFEATFETFQDDSLFPTDEDVEFPESFPKELKRVYRRIFRVWAIIFSHDCLYGKRSQEARELMKHFMFFGWFWELFDEKETKVIDTKLGPYRASFEKQKKLFEENKLPLWKKDMKN